MPKNSHELRDAIHGFVRFDNDEKEIINSRPFQRLRDIHQLATTFLIYPGATHRRFEHSLGVMELAGRVFDIITHPSAVHPLIREMIPQITDSNSLTYWRRVVRLAALCHDLGHLPFSHAAEKELLPSGWDHERLTAEICRSGYMEPIWRSLNVPVRVEDVIKLAVGAKKLTGTIFSNWEAILSEIITGDALGVDRIDYLLRDSHHAGVAYGKFDHFRLIDTLRILPPPEESGEGCTAPTLGVEEGGLHSAEALLLARYFMYTQVYFHHVRRAYDIHLKDFLREWLPDGRFTADVGSHLATTDSEVTVAFWKASSDPSAPGHEAAKRLVERRHFKVAYERNPQDLSINPDSGRSVFTALAGQLGEDNVRRDSYTEKGGVFDFPVLRNDGSVLSAYILSDTLQRLPKAAFDFVFVSPERVSQASDWLKRYHKEVISEPSEEE